MQHPSEKRLHELDNRFAAHVDHLHPQLVRLLASEPFTYATKPKGLASEGVYLFSHGGKHLYVGRTRKFRQRLGNHCRPSSAANQSSFAYKLACELIDFEPEKYKNGNSAVRCVKEIEGLSAAFSDSKRNISEMDIRFVAEADDFRQAMLEMYCSVALETPYNTWKTS